MTSITFINLNYPSIWKTILLYPITINYIIPVYFREYFGWYEKPYTTITPQSVRKQWITIECQGGIMYNHVTGVDAARTGSIH